uniref:Major capsid protein n=1 Tax=Dulem virus 135 TaxID=3145612 RepID=A0AAU8AWY7_9VIRU
MNNSQLHAFSRSPIDIDIKRSTFSRRAERLTSFDAGKLIPLYVSEILPGDTVKMNVDFLCRSLTPLTPVMDRAFIDIHFYFVPNRLVWNHWKEFMGENTSSPWVSETSYEVPTLQSHDDSYVGGYGFHIGSVADYMGLPVGIRGIKVNFLPFRGYALIWNEWYRDENLQSPVNIPLSDYNGISVNHGLVDDEGYRYSDFVASGYVQYGAYGAAPLPVAKFHDYFTSALPSPQKSAEPVSVPLVGYAPVISNPYVKEGDSSSDVSLFRPQFWWDKDGVVNNMPTAITSLYNAGGLLAQGNVGQNSSNLGSILPKLSLVADLPAASAVTINALLNAFSLQRWFERAARGGSRYIETIRAHFGVNPPDYMLARPEFLGGKRIQLSMSQVNQTSQTEGVNALGSTGAYSKTFDNAYYFTKSFVEHGFLFGMVMVRAEHSYSQGINKMWSRKSMTDYYWVEFAHLSEQPIYNREIYAQGTDTDNEVFGYQEAYAEYRYDPKICSGLMRPSLGSAGLGIWNYGDVYTALPTLSPSWIVEPQSNIARTLAVQGEQASQFYGDFVFDAVYTRPMPLYSIPGLLDYN